MTELVQLSRTGNIAVITINNPPVNALSPGVPEGIANALQQIEKDDAVQAAVIIGGGRTFVAGADIKEFGKMTSGKTLVATDSSRYCFASRTAASPSSWPFTEPPSAAAWSLLWPVTIAWRFRARRSVSRK